MFKYLITHWPELNTLRHDYIHNYLALRVELISGERRWYRVGPKLYTAISLYKKQHGHLPYKMLRNAYINVPVTPYFNHNKAGIAVGRIIKLKYRKMKTSELCARSQFVLRDDLKNNLWHCYHYLRHDFGKYSRLQIFVSLYLWHNRLKKEGK